MNTSHTIQHTNLSRKALLVKLTCTKPRTSRRDKEAEAVIQAQLDDTSLSVLSKLFKERDNPVRLVLNKAQAVYAYHREHTLPWSDKGTRLLPVSKYEEYRTAMRAMTAEVRAAADALTPLYPRLVQEDIRVRGTRAKLEDYPTVEEFHEKLQFDFHFQPLPDASHFLFDVSEEDKADLARQVEEAEAAARTDMFARIRTPVAHLAKKLAVPIGQDGAIFRDSAVTNVTEACDLVAELAMGDEEILETISQVRCALPRTVAENPDALRQSQEVRDTVAEQLAELDKRLGFMFRTMEA